MKLPQQSRLHWWRAFLSLSPALLLFLTLSAAQAQLTLLIDFGGDEGNGAGSSPDPWITLEELIQDQLTDLKDGVTVTALDDGFTANNPAPPEEGAEYDSVSVPAEARNDYLYKNVDTAGTEARMRFDGLPAGSYKITMFEGRTTDDNQLGKIWVGDNEPVEPNTDNYAGGSASVEVTLEAGQPLWYKHLEDNTGGVSGMIIRQTATPSALTTLLLDFGGDEGNGAGSSPDPWITLEELVQDQLTDLKDGVTVTALDDGFTANNPAPPEEGAEYDSFSVPAEARNDYLYKNVDTAGTEARMRFDGLPAGFYKITMFEGRTTDDNQLGKIWVGDNEPVEPNTDNYAGGSASVEVTLLAGQALWYKHLEDNTGGISGMIIRQTSVALLPPIALDFGGNEGNGAGAAAEPWITIEELVQDELTDLGGGLTITALDDGFTANNPAPPEEPAEYDGISVPVEARNDYLYKNVDTAGTEARMRIDGLPAGTYNVTVFEGRTTDGDQVAKIWTGDDEPAEPNTGNFAGVSGTVVVNVSAGQALWYKHLEDNTGGISGMIIRQTAGSGAKELVLINKILSSPEMLSFEFRNSPDSVLDRESIVLTVDGEVVTPTITDTENGALVVYTPPLPWIPGSTLPFQIVAKDTNGNDAVRSGEGEAILPTPIMPFQTPLVGPSGDDGVWGVRYLWGVGLMATGSTALEFIQESDDLAFGGRIFDTTAPVADHGGGFFPDGLPYPEEVENDEDGLWTSDDFVVSYKGTLNITEAGAYTFGVHTDDGFGLRIFGAEFVSENGVARIDSVQTNTYAYPSASGDTNSRAVAQFDEPGHYPIEFWWYERGGGNQGELYFAKGSFALDEDTVIGEALAGEWELVGGSHLVAGPQLPFEIVGMTLGNDESVFDFITPAPGGNHQLQTSVNLIDWEIDSNAVFSELGEDVFRLTTAASGDPMLHYRVGIFPPPPVYAEDFESGAEGWVAETQAGDTQWELGTPNAGGLTAAASGDNAWGTNLASDYSPNANLSLRSPVIDLTEIGRPILTFNYFIDSVFDVEGGQFRILNEAGMPLYTQEGIFSGTSDDWISFELRFPTEARGQAVILEFRMLTDGDDSVGAGWYIDDIIIDR